MIASRMLSSVLLVPLLTLPSEAQRLAPVALRMSDAAPMALESRAATAFAPVTDTVPPVRETNAVGTIIGGVLGGVVGTFVGAMIGASARTDCPGEFCGLGGALIGVLIGEPLGLGIGAHLGSRSPHHDHILMTSVASLGILVGGTMAGVALANFGGNVSGIMVPVTPALQLAAALAIESH